VHPSKLRELERETEPDVLARGRLPRAFFELFELLSRRRGFLREIGVELKGVRSGVEKLRGVSGLKARDRGRRETPPGDKKVLKERRSPRRRGRMGTSVQTCADVRFFGGGKNSPNILPASSAFAAATFPRARSFCTELGVFGARLRSALAPRSIPLRPRDSR